MIHYRAFRNYDPPGLVTIWNESLIGRGAVYMSSASPLEYFVFAKPYFDPAGVILAFDGEVPVGFVHAGFGPNGAHTGLDTGNGITCLLAVRPAYRRRGIGTELLRRAEGFLRERGAHTLFAGAMRPLDPFYLGLYGGSESPGFLASDAAAEHFFTRHGYSTYESCLVLHRQLDGGEGPCDGRFPALRRRYEARIVLRPGVGTWWRESVLGPIELLEFRLEDKSKSNAVMARAGVWEMQGFSQRWNESVIGITDVEVKSELRRQGLAKFLVAQIMRQVQEQYFNLVEVQVLESNPIAQTLFRSLGFQQVDTGRMYKKSQ